MEKKSKTPSSDIILSESLKSYFFDQLQEVNKKAICPVPEETLFYSSEVLETCAFSEKFFNIEDGKVKEKVLGLELLKASHYSPEKRRRAYKEIADTALVMTGYFSKSISERIVSAQYYSEIGQTAYLKLDDVQSRCFDVPSFFKVMSTCFENLAEMMSVVMTKNESAQETPYLLNEDFSKKVS